MMLTGLQRGMTAIGKTPLEETGNPVVNPSMMARKTPINNPQMNDTAGAKSEAMSNSLPSDQWIHEPPPAQADAKKTAASKKQEAKAEKNAERFPAVGNAEGIWEHALLTKIPKEDTASETTVQENRNVGDIKNRFNLTDLIRCLQR